MSQRALRKVDLLALWLPVIVLLLMCGAAFAQQSQQPCGPHAQIVKELTAAKYREARIAHGQTPIPGVAIEVYAAAEGKTFTVLLVRADGTTCFIAAGNDFKIFPFPPPGQDI